MAPTPSGSSAFGHDVRPAQTAWGCARSLTGGSMLERYEISARDADVAVVGAFLDPDAPDTRPICIATVRIVTDN